ncbi:MAG: UbiA-like polyprenyltransferase, partial [Phycisphaeraceae bacterium]
PAAGSLTSRLHAVARDIKLSHSVFALPFALLATFLAAGWTGRLPSLAELGLIVLCMVLARTVAMSINRWADASIDAANPRTAGRAIPRGAVSRGFVLGVAIACGAGFVLAAAGFWWLRANPWPVLLSPAVLAHLAAYSFTKRVTWGCHLVLGSALALSPLAASLAIEPGYLAALEPWLIAALVTAWVAGFDIIYALQDTEVDCEQGLFSMPSRLGVGPALWISRALHAFAAAALLHLGWHSDQLGGLFFAAAVATAALLILEHALVWGSKTHRIPLAFLTVNGVISLLLGAAGIAEVVWLGGQPGG